jgi:hypothetical protein
MPSTLPERRVRRRTSYTPSVAASLGRSSHRECQAPHLEWQPDNHKSRNPRGGNETSSATYKPTPDLRCWDHGCNGQQFTTLSNLKRHQREKSSSRAAYLCPLCGAHFSRTTARNQHIQNQSCTKIRRYSNGRQRINKPRGISTSDPAYSVD